MPYVGVSVCDCVRAPCVSVTVRDDAVQMSSMCSHVCVLICLVSVLIMQIMPLSGVCLCGCLFGKKP